MLKNLFRFCSISCLSLALIGCGSGDPSIVPAGGVVNFQGKPIGKINVMLMPTSSSGKIAEGTTDESGKFTLQTMEPGDGAMVGEYKVGFKFVPDEVPAMPGFEGAKKIVSPIPEKYADPAKSGHTAKVEADKSKNNFTFDLK
ncbi:MAG: hypothetical protein U0930_18210 [Pirellulales bacterium]